MRGKELILLVLAIVVVFLIAWIKPAIPSPAFGKYKLVAVIEEADTKIYSVEVLGKRHCGVAISNSFGSGNYAVSISCP